MADLKDRALLRGDTSPWVVIPLTAHAPHPSVIPCSSNMIMIALKCQPPKMKDEMKILQHLHFSTIEPVT